MPNFGYLIIRNPGPATSVEIGGLRGHDDEDTDAFTKCQAAVDAAIAAGHQAHVLVAFEPDESDGQVQVEMYSIGDAAENGALDDEELKAYEEAKAREGT